MNFLLADVGGTKTRISHTSDLEVFSNPAVFETPKNYNEFIDVLQSLKLSIFQGMKFNSGVFGVTGILNSLKTEISKSPHLPNFNERYLKKDLEEIFECNITLQNDTALVGLGEASYGSGKDKEIVVYLTISTGVGGAKIENKQIDKTLYGFEPGHQIINIESGSPRELEYYVSGSGILKRTQQAPEGIDDHDFWEEVNKKLAIGVYNTLLHWSPEIVVLGGGLVNKNRIDPNLIRKEVEKINKILPEIPTIQLAKLEDFGGLYGGMQLLKST